MTLNINKSDRDMKIISRLPDKGKHSNFESGIRDVKILRYSAERSAFTIQNTGSFAPDGISRSHIIRQE